MLTQRWQQVVMALACVCLGVVVGGIVFSRSIPRSFLAVSDCQAERCLKANELVGLMASAGFQITPGLTPRRLKETDKSIIVEWKPGWFVIFPKRDIKNVSLLTPEDLPYLEDSYAIMGDLIRERHMTNWSIFTNGPDVQHVTYLHFHLMDRRLTDIFPSN